jgi:hypothetical protein
MPVSAVDAKYLELKDNNWAMDRKVPVSVCSGLNSLGRQQLEKSIRLEFSAGLGPV